ncbi:helix-turn-helix transcriptional regulator [Variovorax sp. dw_954]|uniref:helix-turn-helix domain-containing protein n=1 Tax=Variovorax sp. dw_954 TaxID=2720078 RepID=UPI001BD44FFA|nr:helix-turn-helix transcriptional regulator [Variovorax sp. dw_954]
MLLDSDVLPHLASRLTAERKRQGLSRSQAAAVCNVSPSFIRDAESDPARCSFGRLLQLANGLGLSLTVSGWSGDASSDTADAQD